MITNKGVQKNNKSQRANAFNLPYFLRKITKIGVKNPVPNDNSDSFFSD